MVQSLEGVFYQQWIFDLIAYVLTSWISDPADCKAFYRLIINLSQDWQEILAQILNSDRHVLMDCIASTSTNISH